MVGRTRLSATDEQRAALEQLARSADRAEADRARAIVWSSEGWTGAVIGGLLGVQADTVRQWRRRFRAGGAAALCTRPKPGKVPWKSRAALAVIEPLLGVVLRNKGISAGVDHATPSKAARTPRRWTGPGCA